VHNYNLKRSGTITGKAAILEQPNETNICGPNQKKPYTFRYSVNVGSCSTKELSVRIYDISFTSYKNSCKKYCIKVYQNIGVNLIWSIDNSLKVINAIESKRYTVSEINTFDCLTLYIKMHTFYHFI